MQIIYKQELVPKTSLIQNRQWEFQPNNSFPLTNLTKTLRIDINGAIKGLFDPRGSYIQVQVAIPPQTKVGGIRLDQCQQNLIQNFRWLAGGKQIQRMTQIAKIQALHNNMGKLQQKRYTGNLKRIKKMNYMSKQNHVVNSLSIYNGSSNQNTSMGGSLSTCGINHTMSPEPIYGGSNFIPQKGTIVAVQQIQRNNLSHLSTQNPYYTAQQYKTSDLDYNQTNYPAYYQNQFGSYKNKRSDYINNACKGGEASWGINKNALRVSNSTNNGQYPFYYSFDKQYSVQFPQKRQTMYARPDIANYTRNIDVSNYVNYTGYSGSFDENYFSYDPDFILSNTIPSISMVNGRFLEKPIPQKSKILRIPIPSAVIGCFIPEHQVRRIPMIYMNQSTIQLTFNPYAFYSTGYKDFCQTDQDGMREQISRGYIINSCKLVFDWYSYEMSPLIQTKLYNQSIVLETDVWQSLFCTTVNGSQVGGTRQISLPYGKLTQLVLFFNSSDYLNYQFCRQSFRVNMGITSIQARYMGNYYPPTPIQGSSANYQYSEDGDNYQFLAQLTKSKLYSPQFCNINGYNFALNDRNYDVTDQNTLYSRQALGCMNLGVKDGSMDKIFTSYINNNTAMGLSQIHQLQCVGRSVFVIPFNQQIISGKQLSNSFLMGQGGKSVQVQIQTSKQVNKNKAQMNVWGCFRRVVRLSKKDKTLLEIVN